MSNFTTFPIPKDAANSHGFVALGYLNVKAPPYGAVGDGVADDTAAIQAAIDAGAALGAAVIYFPDGVYLVNGAMQGTNGDESRLRVPAPGSNDWNSLAFIGGSPAALNGGVVGNFTPIDQGVTIKSTAAGAGAVFGLEPINAGGFLFNMTRTIVKNIRFVTKDNPEQTALDLQYAAQCDVDGVQVDTGVYSLLASEPTNDCVGIRLGNNANGSQQRITNCQVSGYKKGFELGEHTSGDNLSVNGCLWAYYFSSNAHSINFGRLLYQNCRIGLYFGGISYVDIAQLDYEHCITTTGDITSGTDDLVVAAATNLQIGQSIRVVGAGVAGADLVTTITGIAGTAITLDADASTTVNDALVTHGWQWHQYDLYELNPHNYARGKATFHGTVGGSGTPIDVFDVNTLTAALKYSIFRTGKTIHGEWLRDSGGAVSCANGSYTDIPMNFAETGNFGFDWSSSVNPERIYVKYPGEYTVTCTVTFAPHATGGRGVALIRSSDSHRISGNIVGAAGGSEVVTCSATMTTWLSAGEYIKMQAYQSSGGALDTNDLLYYGIKIAISKVG